VGGAMELIEPGATDCCFRREIPPRWLTACAARRPRYATDDGRGARVKAELTFSEKVMVDRYEQLLLEVCGRADHATARA